LGIRQEYSKVPGLENFQRISADFFGGSRHAPKHVARLRHPPC
jgi:hypothetical protein